MSLRREDAVLGERLAERDDVRPAVVRVGAQGARRRAGSPGATRRARRARGVGLDVGAPVAGVEHERLDVLGEVDDAVDVGLDVVVEQVVVGRHRRGSVRQRESRCGAEVLGLEDAVGEAERRPLEGVRGQAHVGRPEAGRGAVGPAVQVEGAVLRTQRRLGVVVGAPEDPALPAPPVTAGVGRQPAVARARLELGPVDAVRRHDGRIGTPRTSRSGWKLSVTRSVGSSRRPVGEPAHVRERPADGIRLLGQRVGHVAERTQLEKKSPDMPFLR